MKIAERKFKLVAATRYAFIPVTIAGPKGRIEANLLLDTGAAQTTLSARLAQPLGYDLALLDSYIMPNAGSGAIAHAAKLEEVQLLGQIRSGTPSRFVDLNYCDGLLGNDLLRSFNLLAVFDVRRGFAKLIVRS